MKKRIAVAVCAAMTVCGFRGMAQTSYDPDGTTLKITVPAGETNSIESAKITSEITEIRKLGLGGLIIDADLTGYTGDIRVEAGTWRVIDSKGLGKLSKTALADDVGKVYVSDGATLEAKCAEAPKYFGKQIHVSGYGVNRLGALLVSGTANCSGSTWGSNLILEGDTYANSITTAIWYYNTYGKQCELHHVQRTRLHRLWRFGHESVCHLQRVQQYRHRPCRLHERRLFAFSESGQFPRDQRRGRDVCRERPEQFERKHYVRPR